mmetsp:Transcript_31107/g.40017  ORF Transcript_31107/g.40017 Transcript_31107/m.40017 type:complete len:120 (-) Transcript_31107:46-405(-)
MEPPGIQYPNELIDPNCQGSMISIPNTNSNNGGGDEVVLYLSNDNSTSSRVHLTVKKSLDNGVTWDQGKLIWNGPSAYSQLVSWKQNNQDDVYTLGVLFELGESSSKQGIGFVTWFSSD